MPLHAALSLEQLERVLCAHVGHRVTREERGAPVLDFWICLRCGKYGRHA